MRSILATAAIIPYVLAAWNPKVCNGVGGCTEIGQDIQGAIRCPNGSRLNVQELASEWQDMTAGEYEYTTQAKFPTSCLMGQKPGPSDSLVIHTTANGQTIFGFVGSQCTTTTPSDDCYSEDDNDSAVSICQIIDSSGKTCTPNPKAGECESWGTSNGRTECAGWKIGDPDKPADS